MTEQPVDSAQQLRNDLKDITFIEREDISAWCGFNGHEGLCDRKAVIREHAIAADGKELIKRFCIKHAGIRARAWPYMVKEGFFIVLRPHTGKAPALPNLED